MIALSLLLAGAQIHGTDVPESFQTAEMRAYFSCVRVEAKGGSDQSAPKLVQFTQLMRLCGEERLKWANVLRPLIQVRHPDWTKERVGEAVEFVITGFELQRLVDRQRPPPVPVHDTPEPQF